MKTLQEEVVEALNEAYSSALSCQDNFTLFRDLKQLAKRVEQTHCTNCDKYIHDKHFPGCSIFDVDEQDVAFSCAEFKLKVE